MKYLTSLLVSGLVVLVTSELVSGVHCSGYLTAILVALVYSAFLHLLAIPVFLASVPAAFLLGSAAPITGPMLVVLAAIFVTACLSLVLADWLLAGFLVTSWSGAFVACVLMAVFHSVLYGLGVVDA